MVKSVSFIQATKVNSRNSFAVDERTINWLLLLLLLLIIIIIITTTTTTTVIIIIWRCTLLAVHAIQEEELFSNSIALQTRMLKEPKSTEKKSWKKFVHSKDTEKGKENSTAEINREKRTDSTK